jgi:hypothetical protein
MSAIDIFPCPVVFNQERIRHTFLNIFTSILRNYRHFLNDQPNHDEAHESEDSLSLHSLFKTAEFLADLDLESKAFMDHFTQTQSFYEFIRERRPSLEIHYETLFLDESVKAKLNRSRLQLHKLSTSFLSDDAFDINLTVFFAGPNEEGVSLDGRGDFIFNIFSIP